MEDITTLAQIINEVGVPILFFAVCTYLLFKCFPEWMKLKKEEREASFAQSKEQQAYTQERQKAYEEQMQIIVKVAEQGSQMIGQASQVISQSTEVIRMNTEAIKASTEVHARVIRTLEKDEAATLKIASDLQAHNQLAEKIYTNVEKLLDRTS